MNICGQHLTPVDYYLNCELNSALVLMSMEIPRKHKALLIWQGGLNSIEQTKQVRDKYSERIEGIKKKRREKLNEDSAF